jgi:type VI secretion system secreted protein VgrG
LRPSDRLSARVQGGSHTTSLYTHAGGVKAMAANGTVPLPNSKVKLFDRGFMVKSEQSGKAQAYQAYKTHRADGSVEEGVTNKEGLTHVVLAPEAECWASLR